MNQKDFSLSMDGEAFASLRSDFDQVLRSTLAGMVETDQSQAEIGIKVKITLTEDSAPDFTVAGGHSTREITKPKFEHTVTAVIQRKEKKTGVFAGEYELVWDREACKYVARPIEDGQQTLFDDDEPEHVDLGEQEEREDGPLGLPEAVVSDEAEGGEDVPEEGEDGVPDAADEFEEEESGPDPAHDPSKPFGWLRQFIGETMRVSEAMGNYAVRTSGNRIVLSSATSPENPFYCPAEKLAPHVDHPLVCVGYGDEEIVNIAIECEDCNEVLYSLDAPGYGPEEDTQDDDDDDGQDIDYGEPEE